MSLPAQCLPPTSSLPPARSLASLTEDQISCALRNLHLLYCPLRLPPSFQPHLGSKTVLDVPPVDSGYASHNEEDDDSDADDAADALAALRADPFERNFAVRWLTTFIARADELSLACDDTRSRFIDAAAAMLASFNDPVEEDEEEGTVRDFSFPLSSSSSSAAAPRERIHVRLNDAPLSGTDHTDVGLQSWGAAVILSDLLCAAPARFLAPHHLATRRTGAPPTTVVELGAGTGLVSLVLAQLLPRLAASPGPAPAVVATDYHPAVLQNLRANIASNASPVHACLLDWAAPAFPPPLHRPAQVLVAADVIYAREHAMWLRDCAARMLAPDGVFWLIATVRPTGRFEGITETVEEAFEEGERAGRAVGGRALKILEMEKLEKRKGVGRGDESGYRLYRIGWA
ncbi:hypothetical protein B0J12DRAFT_605615 [Macrophomina phaseolina]|uniref:Nicotinamide N-methyltransferase n=1 Tax=Macrophomina phaseolina TaxID=35725 RepID=A0ABQ8G1K9_9PEZI|nr:hypothetical protein B0J12DRAFT_605615 [Macrophomina phaseolina]